MRGVGRFVLGLAAFALGGTAAAQDAAEGFYVTEQMEMASMLELAPEGRFRWMLTYGALDLSAGGRWRREGDAVLLDTEPPVTAPRFEYLGAGREEAAALVVRIEDESGNTPEYLDVEAVYDSGEPGYASLDGDAYRFEPAPGRQIVAIRVGSGAFRFWSQRFTVPAAANQMRFRFFPGDLGRADFRGTRAALEGDALLLPVLGEPLRYRRLTAEENAELRTAIAEIGSAVAASAAEEAEAGLGEVPSSTDMADNPGAGATPMDTDAGATTLIDAENHAYWRQCGDPQARTSAAEAIAGCTRLIEGGWLDTANLAIAHTNRGLLLSDEEDYPAARADFDTAIGLNPEWGMAYWGRAGVHEASGDFPAALADVREAARLLPEHPDALNSLCWYLAIAGEELDRAREACDASLRIRPDDADTLDSRGLVGLKQERFQEAWADYDAAARINPDFASFAYGRGIAALRLGRTAEGRTDLARAAALDPAIAETYARHGVRP